MTRATRTMIPAPAGLRILAAAAFLLAGIGSISAQVHVAGQASAAWLKSGTGLSQYAYNGGRGTFQWRGDLFVDAELSDNVFFQSSFHMEQDRKLGVDLFVIRVTDVFSLPLSIEAGETEIPFGNLGDRRYPKTNAFLSLPLGREHRTTLRSSDYVLWTDDARYTALGNGVKILDGGLYDAGVKISGSVGIVDYAFAVTNGMLSATSTYSSDGLDGNKGLGKTARLSVTPMIGLTIGASYAQGPFLREGSASSYGYGYGAAYDPNEYSQEALGGDVDFSFGHVAFYGEAFMNSWKFSDAFGTPLKAAGYSVEGHYTVAPRFSVGARVGELFFNKVLLPEYASSGALQPWDNDMLRAEAAVGYRLSREALLKAVYVWNRTFGVPEDPRDNMIGVQTVVSF